MARIASALPAAARVHASHASVAAERRPRWLANEAAALADPEVMHARVMACRGRLGHSAVCMRAQPLRSWLSSAKPPALVDSARVMPYTRFPIACQTGEAPQWAASTGGMQLLLGGQFMTG